MKRLVSLDIRGIRLPNLNRAGIATINSYLKYSSTDRRDGRVEAYISLKTTRHKSMGLSARYLQSPREPAVFVEY